MLFASCGNRAQGTVWPNAETGTAWEAVLSEADMSRTSLAIAPSNQDVIYALASSLGDTTTDPDSTSSVGSILGGSQRFPSVLDSFGPSRFPEKPQVAEVVRRTSGTFKGRARTRFEISLLAGLAVGGVNLLAPASPVQTNLDLWAAVFFAFGLLFGPAGIFGNAAAYLITEPWSTSLQHAVHMTGAYSLLGASVFAIFRWVPGLRRSLPDLRSYLAILAAALFGSVPVALIGSADLFFPGKFWTITLYFFGRALSSLLIATPFFVLVAHQRFHRWLITLPEEGDGSFADRGRTETAVGKAEEVSARYIFVGTATIVGITVVVVPLALVRPQYGDWLNLFYLLPILWGSINYGLRGGILVASGSGLAWLLCNASLRFFLQAPAHAEVSEQFSALVVFSVIGAVTGSFQQDRLKAEQNMRRSRNALAAQHQSLQVIHHLAERLHRQLDEKTIAGEAVSVLIKLSQAPLVAVYLLDDDGTQLRGVAHHGFGKAAGARLPVTGSLNGVALAEKKVQVSEHPTTDDRVEPAVRPHMARLGVTLAVCIPLVFEEHALGTIDLLYRHRRQLGPDELNTLRAVGQTVALALVNAQKKAVLEHQAFHDPLTDLPNRAALHCQLESLLETAEETGERVGLALVDLNRFKEVNDALGHHVGDRLLIEIGPRMESAKVHRQLTVFRLGGDEFAVVIPHLREPGESESITRRMLDSLKMPITVGGIRLEIGASAGVSIYPDDGSDSHELLRCADVAMYQAKKSLTGVSRYSREIDQNTPERLALAADLEDAIINSDLVLHFQPLVTLADRQGVHSDRRVVGFEALVRWQHPGKRRLLQPIEFMPMAEVGDLIHPLTDWVIRNALMQLRQWLERQPELTMSINLSTRNLLDRACADRLGNIIEEVGVHPNRVELELTETALLIDPEAAVDTLKRITGKGFRLAIDDFGAGYSSLAYLKRFPIHTLKIDRSFVTDMVRQRQSLAIVRSTVQLAHNLGAVVVAEGVEDNETDQALRDMKCDLAQGFLYSAPAPADKFGEWLFS